MLCWDFLQAITSKHPSLNDSEGHAFAECCNNNEGELLHTNINRTLENLCCTGCRVPGWMAKSFTPWSLCIMQMRPLFRTLDDCPFTFIRIYTLSHTSGQYGPTNAKHSNTDLSILYRQQWLLCRGIVREQKRQCVRERRKERILRGISASVIDLCMMPSRL